MKKITYEMFVNSNVAIQKTVLEYNFFYFRLEHDFCIMVKTIIYHHRYMI